MRLELSSVGMAALDPNLLETLLNMTESGVLDFKQAAYPLANATDDQKSEIVKDIVAFANAWKTSDAHIVLGVVENLGGRGTVVGVDHHPNDATLQQLVNSKTNTPVDFSYIPASCDGKDIGIIRVAQHQNRPIFLPKKFGRLEPNQVYIRRGSSTGVATPDEIARMGVSSVQAAMQPAISLGFGDGSARRDLGSATVVHSRLLRDRGPTPAEIEELLRVSDLVLGIPKPSKENEAKLKAYRKTCGLLTRLTFNVRNAGEVLVLDLRLVAKFPKVPGVLLYDQFPKRPPTLLHEFISTPRLNFDTHIQEADDTWELVARMGKIQPGARVWSAPFWVGTESKVELPIQLQAFADNIAKPFQATLNLTIDTMLTDSLPDPAEEESED